jgi:mannose-6-phosphate isomerase
MDPSFNAPLRFSPILKRLIWGGRRLGTLLGRPLGPGSDYAESWELADHGDDVSRVEGGPWHGRSLRELVGLHGDALLGWHGGDRHAFPLLVKLLDANQTLSVQVHPDDARGALLVGDRGKTEAWVIFHADPGSLIYAGLRQGTTPEALRTAVATGEVEPLLHRFAPQAGDCVFIPAGTVHAIGAGVVLLEIQQSSDATFRLHDWGRLDATGRPRPLHIEQAMSCIDFELGPVDPVRVQPAVEPWGVREPLVDCPHFAFERLRLRGTTRVGRADRFTVLVGLEGVTELTTQAGVEEVRTGQVLLLPAELGAVTASPGEAGSVLLTCHVP